MRRLIVIMLMTWIAGCAMTPVPIAQRGADVFNEILADGQPLFYRVAEKNGLAPPVVLIHGVADSSESWESIAGILSDSHPVYAIDMAGYGYSERPVDYDTSVSAQADYLLEFINKKQLERVILVGHDIGGAVAQIMAVRNPQRVQALILVNSVIDDNWPVFEMRLLQIPVMNYMALTLLEEPLWQHVMSKGFYDQHKVTKDLVHRYQRWYQGSTGRKRLIQNTVALKNKDLLTISDAIRAHAVPTLILWGRHDRYLEAEPAIELCESMKNCRFEFIEDAGHFVTDEQPERVAEGIRHFLME
jgi:2-hydroxymuconate-semialdehyde hydrolase